MALFGIFWVKTSFKTSGNGGVATGGGVPTDIGGSSRFLQQIGLPPPSTPPDGGFKRVGSHILTDRAPTSLMVKNWADMSRTLWAFPGSFLPSWPCAGQNFVWKRERRMTKPGESDSSSLHSGLGIKIS